MKKEWLIAQTGGNAHGRNGKDATHGLRYLREAGLATNASHRGYWERIGAVDP